MKFDADRVLQLLNIVESTTKVAPGYNHLIGEAMAELRQINEDVRKANEIKQGKPVTPAAYGDKNSPRPTPISEYGVTNPVASAPLDDQTPEDAPDEILTEPSNPVIAGRRGYVPGTSEAQADTDSPSNEAPTSVRRP